MLRRLVGELAARLGGARKEAQRQREACDTLRDQGDLEGSLRHGSEAVRLRPDWAEGHNSRGITLHYLGRLDEAIAAYRRAIAARPGYAAAYINLANALMDQGQLDAAIAHYRDAVRLAPGNAMAHHNLAMALQDDGQHEAALASYREALRLGWGDGVKVKIAFMLPHYPRSGSEIAEIRRRFGENISALLAEGITLDDPAREVGQTNFLLPYQGLNDKDLQVRVAGLYERACPSLLYVAPHCRAAGRGRRDRLRVGFASRHFSAHSVGIWFNRVIEGLAALPEFEVVLLTWGGPVDEALRRACARHVVLPGDVAAARTVIAAQELDVLVYADIGMEPLSYFLAFSRLAPVQCAMLGHPVTTGIRNVDYFISSALFEGEGAEAHYSERLVKLDSLPVYIYRPQPPASPRSRRELGLPEDRTLYVSPMMLHKFHPDFDRAMAEILRRDPRAEIVLFRDRQYPNRHERLAARWAQTLPDVRHRVRFLPWASTEDLMSIILVSDVIIDTFYFTAGTTAFLVLGLGTPIVTLPGEFARGRPTHGCYLKMGVMDCVARDARDYVDIAVRLGTDKAFREAVSQRILERNPVLFEDRAVVAELARFLRESTRAG
jgi:predicted O-linked N-acetylglucosamine transferase (SPINDLY family)